MHCRGKGSTSGCQGCLSAHHHPGLTAMRVSSSVKCPCLSSATTTVLFVGTWYAYTAQPIIMKAAPLCRSTTISTSAGAQLWGQRYSLQAGSGCEESFWDGEESNCRCRSRSTGDPDLPKICHLSCRHAACHPCVLFLAENLWCCTALSEHAPCRQLKSRKQQRRQQT